MGITQIRVLCTGPTPPPTNGRSVVTGAVISELEREGFKVRHLNYGGMASRLTYFGKGARAGSIPRIFAQIIFNGLFRGYSVVYLPLSGGNGQVLDLFVALAARLAQCRLVIHHHSFAYLNSYRFLTAIIMGVAGPRTIHITLGPTMEARLKELYRAPQSFFASNAKFIACQRLPAGPALTTVRIGFLGNISESKGILEFLEICRTLADEDISFNALIAGPCADELVSRNLEATTTALPSVQYIGPVYGQAKAAFFQSIDVLIFPSRYENEAEPLVILESLSFGVPVIATIIGEVERLLSFGDLQFTFKQADFIHGGLSLLRTFADPNILARQKAQATARFEKLHFEAQHGYSNLFKRLSDPL